MIYAIQYSVISKRKSRAYKACLNGFSGVCVINVFSCLCAISVMDDGNCSPGGKCNSSVVQESMW